MAKEKAVVGIDETHNDFRLKETTQGVRRV